MEQFHVMHNEIKNEFKGLTTSNTFLACRGIAGVVNHPIMIHDDDEDDDTS